MKSLTEQWNAADYHQQSSAQETWAKELLQKLHLCGSESVLDLGCGTGRITALLAERLKSGHVVGIDASSDMITFAQRTYTQYANLQFFHMDACALDLAQSFDGVFSNAVMHWIKDHLQVLQRIRAHLKPGGRILFQMGGRNNVYRVQQTIDAIITLPEWEDYFEDFEIPYHFYGVEEYSTWLPLADFRSERVELISKDMQQPGVVGFKGWLRTTWFPFINQVPVAQQNRFTDQVAEAYVAQYPLDELGWVHVPMVRLEVEAVAC
jgi:trans-aconitate 2-methyltransferase